MAISAGYRGGTTWRREARGRDRARSLGWLLARRGLAVPLALYALAAGLVLWNLGVHPDYAYNWEAYTIRDLLAFWGWPDGAIFCPTDGLMTNSGSSPLIALPVWIAFKLGGVGLLALRLPLALLAGLAVPLLFALGRRLAGAPAAAIAALLLALTPSFLLYARTATLVGLSVALALGTALVLLRLLERPKTRWALLALPALLVVNSYGYAPLRFLWPLGLALLGWELLRRRGERRWFLLALLAAALAIPAFVLATDELRRDRPVVALIHYYNGGGEQLRQMSIRPANFEPFLREKPTRAADGRYQATPAELARQLIAQNASDFANLLLDRGTKPALIDYWTPRGRLYAGLLVPFALLGLARSLWRAWRHLGDRALLTFAFGFGLPMLLTSLVHVGRLVFFLPFLLLLCANGFVLAVETFGRAVGWVLAKRGGRADDTATHRRALLAVLAAVLLLAVGQAGWDDYRVPPGPRKEWRRTAVLRAALPEAAQRGAVVLVVNDGTQRDGELLDLGQYRLALYNQYRFVDLLAAETGNPLAGAADGDGRPALYYGAPLARARELASRPGGCATLYLVAPEFERAFTAASARHAAVCGAPPTYRLLPE